MVHHIRGILRRPGVRCPDNCRFGGEDDAQGSAAPHAPQGMVEQPDFVAASHGLDHVALIGRFDPVKANAVVAAADQRDIFGVRPA